jgi:homoserine dehydrogenase
MEAIAAGKHVVTANKALLAVHGRRSSPRRVRKA